MVSMSGRASFYIVLTLFTMNTPRIKSKDTSWIHNITNQLCPYTDFCHAKASKVFNYDIHNNAPCCGNCSCDDDCMAMKNCCPDKTIVSHNSVELECKNSMVKRSSRSTDADRSYDGFSYGIKFYYITGSCPARETDQDIQHRCLGTNRTTLDDYVWVFDTATGKIFKNRHCAECHGIKAWEPFNIRAHCINTVDNSFDNLTSSLLSNDCNIINEISDEHAAMTETYRCFTPAISSCNQTGRWRKYDADIDAACQTNTVPFFQTNFNKMTLYKNIFCYVCNVELINGAGLVCQIIHTDDRFTGTTFNALINYKAASQTEEKPVDSACTVDQIYDKFMAKCRKLLCPFGSKPESGKCKTLAVNMNNVGVCIELNLIIDWSLTKLQDMNQTNIFSETDGEDIARIVATALKVKACNLCLLQLKLTDRNPDSISKRPLPDLDFWLTVSTNNNCQYMWLHENIDRATQRVMKVPLQRGPIFLRLKYDPRPIEANRQVYDYLYFDSLRFCSWSVVLKAKLCPGISLMKSELENFKTQKVKYLLDPLSGDDVNATATVFICVEDYFKIMKQINTAERAHVVLLVLVLVQMLTVSL